MKYLKIIYVFLLIFMFCLITGCNDKEEENNYDYKEYDISENNDGTVKAIVQKVDNNYSLRISGAGYTKDYQSKEMVPWNPLVKRIDSIIIDDGIISLGDYLFNGISYKEILLPNSVIIISEHTFNSLTKIYTYNDLGITLSNLYMYSETPRSGYFHIVDGEYVVWNSYQVLFIGNSFTYRSNDATNPLVPALFKLVGDYFGIGINYDFVVEGSMKLSYLFDDSREVCSKFNSLINNNEYDYIIIQEQSTLPINDYNGFKNSVSKLKQIIKQKQPKAEIYLYETWASPGGLASVPQTTETDMERALNQAYTNVASELGLKVNYVGAAFEMTRANTSIYLYDTDERHQNANGAYLSSLVHFGSIFGVDVTNVSLYGDNTEVINTLNRIAAAIVSNTSFTNNEPDYTKASVVIAWYDKEATSGLNKTIINDWLVTLKAYLKNKGYTDEVLEKIMVKGYSGKVLDSCTAIKEDGFVDLMVGWKSNVSTTGNLEYLDCYPNSDEGGLTMGHVEGRWIHLLTSNSLALDIYNWLKQDGITSLEAN